jgi:hypothetical protein
MRFSYWEKDRLLGPHDLIVIGAGLTGLTAALQLKRQAPQQHVLVLERGALPRGASTRNAGFACIGAPGELLADIEQQGAAKTLALVQRRYEGLQRLRSLLDDEALAYRPTGGTEVFWPEAQAHLQHCVEALPWLNDQLRSLGKGPAYTCGKAPAGLALAPTAIHNAYEGLLHPGKMMQALLKKAEVMGIKVLFGAPVAALEGGLRPNVILDEGETLSAERILVSTNGFARQLLPELPLLAVRNQVLLTENLPQQPLEAGYHLEEGYIYFRPVGRRILIGGGRNEGGPAEETDQLGLTDPVQKRLEQLLAEVILPGQAVAVEHRWSGILGVGPEKEPLLGEYRPGIWAAVRLGGMGIALGTALGQEAAAQLQG